MNRLFVFTIALSFSSIGAFAQLPTDDEFRPVPQFPEPADSAFTVVGTANNDGQFIFWNGDAVYRQDTSGGHELTKIAEGYLGDPAFVAVSPNQDNLLLGTGFGIDGTNQKLYVVNLQTPVDFMEGDGIPAPNHFSGDFLNNNLVIMDRFTDDFSATELVVIDISTPKTRNYFVSIIAQPDFDEMTRQQVIEKPVGSYSSKVFVDRNRNFVYSMDGNTLTLRRFELADVINAFEKMTTLDWNLDGTPVGTPGELFSEGVAGISGLNDMIIGGSSGIGLPGGVQIVQNLPDVEILTTLDPAGTQPFYNAIYNAQSDEIIAIDATFGQPLVAYARDTGIAPIPAENPCDVEEMILEQFMLLKEDFPDLADDIDEDMILDSAMLNLFLFVSCRVTEEAVVDATRNAYDQNLEILDTEVNALLVADYREILAVLLSMNATMQSNLLTFLMNNGISLTNDYIGVTCSDTENCLPEYVEDPDVSRRAAPRALNEPYSGSGDMDGDETTNLDEYLNVIAIGGDESDFSIAAFSDLLDGTSDTPDFGSGGGSCFIAYLTLNTGSSKEMDGIRQFRNNHLLNNPLGTAFSSTYYKASPQLIYFTDKFQNSGLAVQMILLIGCVLLIVSFGSRILPHVKRLFERVI
jgi:hypothetical protein